MFSPAVFVRKLPNTDGKKSRPLGLNGIQQPVVSNQEGEKETRTDDLSGQ